MVHDTQEVAPKEKQGEEQAEQQLDARLAELLHLMHHQHAARQEVEPVPS